jgi:hypothetical protein
VMGHQPGIMLPTSLEFNVYLPVSGFVLWLWSCSFLSK